jgi:hypothetical protein
MFDNKDIQVSVNSDRKVENIIFKLTTRDKYIISKYQDVMNIDNRSTWLMSLIEKDINEKIEKGFFTL